MGTKPESVLGKRAPDIPMCVECASQVRHQVCLEVSAAVVNRLGKQHTTP